MSATVSELIGRIIHPASAPASPAPRREAAATTEPLSVLLGRIIAPYGYSAPAPRTEPAGRGAEAPPLPTPI